MGPSCSSLRERTANNSVEVANKGQPMGELYPHFALAHCYAHPIALESAGSRPWLLSPSINPSNPSIYRVPRNSSSCSARETKGPYSTLLSARLFARRPSTSSCTSSSSFPSQLLAAIPPKPHASSVLTTTFSRLSLPACCAALPKLFLPRLRRPARIHHPTGLRYGHSRSP